MFDLLARRLPSPLALYLPAMAAVAVALAFLGGLRDSDVFWHYMNGRYTVAHGWPPMADLFSFTHPGGQRTPHEWLSEVLIYGGIEWLGPDLTLALFALALPIGLGAVALALRARGVATLPLALATALSAAVALPYASVRPQVLSWMLLGVLVAVLMTLRPDRRWLPFGVVPLFAVWANLHGLYAVGLAVLGWYLLFTLIGRTPMAADRGRMLAVTVASFAASALTPSGLPGLLYPLRFLDAGDWGLAHIPEWQSPNFHDAVQLPLLALIVAVAALGWRGGSGWLRGLACVGVALALLANRNAPVVAMLALPTLAFALDGLLAHRMSRPASPRQAGARRVVEAAAALAVAITAVATLPGSARGITLTRFPAAAVDVLARTHPDARVLAEYGWGGYVIYRLHDAGGRVFVDGRNDLYPEAVLEDYSAIRAADPGWRELLATYRIEAILFPPDATLVRGPAQAAGWCEAYGDERQVLLLPDCDP